MPREHPEGYAAQRPQPHSGCGSLFRGPARRIRASGGGTDELSSYPALTNLLNAVGGALRPKVFCVSQLAQQGAGHPDFGLYAARQVQRGQPKQGQTPECGVMEVKPAGDDAWLTADSGQVSRYWERYRLVLVTNTRDFVLLGKDAHGRPAKLETFRLAGSPSRSSSLGCNAPVPSPGRLAQPWGSTSAAPSPTGPPSLSPGTWPGCWTGSPTTCISWK